MAKIDDNTIRRIKDTADIVEVVSDFVDLKRSSSKTSPSPSTAAT